VLEHLLLGGGFGDARDGGNVEEGGHRDARGRTLSVADDGVMKFRLMGMDLRALDRGSALELLTK
jgi:hypothetical protein